jgi:hypothetical protein
MTQKRRVLFIALSALSLSGLAACGKLSDAIQSTDQAVSAHELQHSFKDSCSKNIALTAIGSSEFETYQFSGNSVTKTDEYFSSGDCTTPAVMVVYNGTFEKKDQVQQNTYQINATFTTVTVTPQDDQGKTLLNTLSFCGITNWTTGTAVDLSAQAGVGLCSLDKLPKSVFDIYSVDNNVLYLGKGSDKSTADRRPTDVDRSNGYTQQ